MSKRILLIRSQDIFTDTRVLRYEEWFNCNQVNYKILGWDRNNKNLVRENTDYCKIHAGFNLGLGGIKYRIKWNLFLIKYLLKNRNEFDIIHACDFDTVWPAILMKIFSKKVIFDIFDWFSDEVRTGNFIIDNFINFMEKLATKIADMTILCEEGRLKQIEVIPKNYMVIPNIPAHKYVDFIENNVVCASDNICIAYVGGFYADRGLLELLEVLKNLPYIELHIAGFGDKNIEQKIISYSESYDNIKFYGKVQYNKAVEIMKNADALYAMYYKINRNNVFAAPNKFYESIFLQKPIITTRGTLVGDKVLVHESGYVIEEGTKALELFLTKIRKVELEKFSGRLAKYCEIYRELFSQCMQNYAKQIRAFDK